MSSLHPSIIAALVGLLSGTHTAIWGMYKDSVHEGFELSRFTRSMLVGSVSGVILQALLKVPVHHAAGLIVLFGLAYATERGIVEVWKTFLREEDQSKYFIPMQFSIRGEPVKDPRVRIAAGVAYVLGVGISLSIIAALDHGGPVDFVRAALVGLATGLIIAIGGCWKDAPKEGFDPIKFGRSPAWTIGYALILSYFTDSYLLIAIGSIGYERATVETYKKFFFPSTPPGKFAGKPVTHPQMLHLRRYFVPAYAAIWGAVIFVGTLAILT